MFKNILVIGASRGLGHSLVQAASQRLSSIEEIFTVSRSPKLPLNLPERTAYEHVCADLSHVDGQNILIQFIKKKQIELIFYAAGGGPHGPYGKKEWKDHLWSLEVGLLAPMRIVHAWLTSHSGKSGVPRKFVIVGSQIAESKPDPLAASYSAGKHGLLGFVSSLQDELSTSDKKVWLFSPAYMDTDMLPRKAWVRHNGTKIMSPDETAESALRWAEREGPWHYILE